MAEDALPTGLYLEAHLLRLDREGIPAAILARGDPERGLIVLKLNQGENGCRVLTQTRDAEGRLAWFAAKGGALLPEVEADALIDRARTRDRDLWVVEVTDRAGRHPFEGRVL